MRPTPGTNCRREIGEEGLFRDLARRCGRGGNYSSKLDRREQGRLHSRSLRRPPGRKRETVQRAERSFHHVRNHGAEAGKAVWPSVALGQHRPARLFL